MFKVTYLVFIRYRGPLGISIPIPRFRTAHLPRPKRLFERFDLSEALQLEKEEDWLSTIPHYLRYPTPIPYYSNDALLGTK